MESAQFEMVQPNITCTGQEMSNFRRDYSLESLLLIRDRTLFCGPLESPLTLILLIFRWPPVLAWWHDTTVGRVLAMLISVPL